MEVWLESLSMHLSVGMPLPPDLLFDIHHYKGQSPSSSGSTTPEGIPSGHRSPALEPICEGQTTDSKKCCEKLGKSMEKIPKSTENLKPIIKVSSAENVLKRNDIGIRPIIKVSSSSTLPETATKSYEFSTKSCENIYNTKNNTCDISMPTKNNPPVILNSPGEYPNYENIDFLKNDMVFAGDSEKPICIQELKETDLCKIVKSPSTTELNKCSTNNENNLKQTNFNVNLRNVPKNFTRNRFSKEIKENSKDEDSPSVRDKLKFLSKSKTFDIKPLACEPSKVSNLNLDSIGLKTTTLPSQVTRKYVNSAKNVNLSSNNSLSMLPKSNSFDKSLNDSCCSSKPSSSKSDPTSDVKAAFRSSLTRRRYTKESENIPLSRRTPVLQKRDALKSPTKERKSLNDSRKMKQSAAERLKETLTANERLPEEKINYGLSNKTKVSVDQEVKQSSSLLNKLTPILQRRTGFLNLETDINMSKKPFAVASSSGNIVRDMVDSLNKKGSSLGFGSRVNFGRSSLKVTRSPKSEAKTVGRFNPTKEYTAL